MQGESSADAIYLGVQRAAGSAEFYVELLDSISASLLGENREFLSILENPSKPLSVRGSTRKLQPQSPSVVLGGGFENAFGRIPEVTNRVYFGVRGYLTLNRLPSEVEANATIGELALLASRLQIPSSTTSNLLYVHVNSKPLSQELIAHLRKIGADLISLDQGLEYVVSRVRGSELIISDGVIGLAIADGFGIPNVWHQVSANSTTQFQVIDYLLGVERPAHLKILAIPFDRALVEKKARIAERNIVENQINDLVGALEKIAELYASFMPTEVVSVPVAISSEAFYASISGGPVQAGKFQFDYSYLGGKTDRQVVVSFDLKFNTEQKNADIALGERLPYLFKSPREDIGYYRYLDLDNGRGRAEILFELPDGIVCRGIKLLRWSDPDGQIEILRITHTKFR